MFQRPARSASAIPSAANSRGIVLTNVVLTENGSAKAALNMLVVRRDGVGVGEDQEPCRGDERQAERHDRDRDAGADVARSLRELHAPAPPISSPRPSGVASAAATSPLISPWCWTMIRSLTSISSSRSTDAYRIAVPCSRSERISRRTSSAAWKSRPRVG
jgi:hypothetical protein